MLFASKFLDLSSHLENSISDNMTIAALLLLPGIPYKKFTGLVDIDMI
jgi:hypothetical protein